MNEQAIHSRLQELIKLAPTLKGLLATDVVFSISDREKILLQLQSKLLPIADNTGYYLTSKDPMYDVIHENKRVVTQLPKEAYGYAFRTVIVPVEDDNHRVIGSIAVTESLDNQEDLVQVAQQLAASSEEISASTTEMSSSAKDLMDYMNNLMVEHNEVNKQMSETEKMLELINSIAQSSRILGLNAGIEAARSGEHGRGFSIVAKEITKLADRSADSVEQIRQLLNSVKEKVDHVAATVTQTVDISENQSTAINEISEAIHHLTVVAEDIEELSRKI